MRVYTHGARRGVVELLKSESALLEKANSLLKDIEAHADGGTAVFARNGSNAMVEVIERLAGRKDGVAV